MGKNPYKIQSVPGEFGGITFRSQLEINWAQWLTQDKIAWLYEEPCVGVQGYLPDFTLFNVNGERFYLEVKPHAWDGYPRVPSEWVIKAQAVGKRHVIYMVFGGPVERMNEAVTHMPGSAAQTDTVGAVKSEILEFALREP